MREVIRSKHYKYIEKDGKYFLLDCNQYTNGTSITEINFDKNGIAIDKFGKETNEYSKDKLDILFATSGKEISE